MGKRFVVSGAVRQNADTLRVHARPTPEQQREMIQTILASDLPEAEKRVVIECVMAGAFVDLLRLRARTRMPGIPVGSVGQRAHAATAMDGRMPGIPVGHWPSDALIAHRSDGRMPGLRIRREMPPRSSRTLPSGQPRMPGIDLGSLR